MTLDPQDVIDAHLNQIIGMAKAHAETAAMLEAAKREIAALKAKYEHAPSSDQ